MGELNWYDKTLTDEDRKAEKWEDLPRTNGKYRISSLGRIMSDFGQGYRNITPQKNQYGQLVAQLTSTNTSRSEDLMLIMIGKTVAELFVPNPEGYKYIRFKNGNSLDCRASNIEWTRVTDKMSEQYKALNKKVNQYALDGTYITTFDSLTEAAAQTGASTITTACKEHKLSNGYQWRYANEIPEGENIEAYEQPKEQGYIQLDKKTLKEIRRFSSIQEAVDTLTVETGKKADRANIFSCAKGKRPSACGYKWAFAEEE